MARHRRHVIDYARMARLFPENGLKLLLENARNVRDFLPLSESPLVTGIDCDRLRRIDTTFVQRDYRHVACDLLYTAPFHHRAGGKTQTVMLYLLIEQQSKPEEVMPLRGTDYVTEIYRKQARDWWRAHRSWNGIELQPVLPVIFYTGTRRWDDIGRLSDLVVLGDLFRRHIPDIEACYVNLRETPVERLVSAAGYFGRVLHVLQHRKSSLAEFDRVLREEVSALEGLRGEDRARWLELLTYLVALVYHDRIPSERADLQETVEASVETDVERREVRDMGQTIAQYLQAKGKKEGKKEGQLEGLQNALLLQLRQKFGSVSVQTEEAIKAMTKVRQLNTWLGRVLSAESLDEMGIDS